MVWSLNHRATGPVLSIMRWAVKTHRRGHVVWRAGPLAPVEGIELGLKVEWECPGAEAVGAFPFSSHCVLLM